MFWSRASSLKYSTARAGQPATSCASRSSSASVPLARRLRRVLATSRLGTSTRGFSQAGASAGRPASASGTCPTRSPM